MVSIIIKSEDLRESCLNQTVKCEVVDSFEKATGDSVIFIDEAITPDFIEKMLEPFDESTPFVYCESGEFGKEQIPVYSWGTEFIWHKNFINAPVLMRKDALVKVGGLDGNDWSLVLRLARLGKPRKSSATYYGKKKENPDIRKALVTVSVGLIYSGRINGFIDVWINRLINDIKILKNKPQLIIVNNSSEKLEFDQSYFSEVKILSGNKKKYEAGQRAKICDMLSDQYNIILENATGDLIHMREDDIIPLPGSFEKLFNFVFNDDCHAISGIYLNRNSKEPDSHSGVDDAKGGEPQLIKRAGTGFILYWKDVCPKYSPRQNGLQAQDWVWCDKLLTNGGKLWLDPTAVCRHYIDEVNYVEYKQNMTINASNVFIKTMEIRPVIIPKRISVIKQSMHGNQRPLINLKR
jgi:hypothetical protein